MRNPFLALNRHYHCLRQQIDKTGIRETARRCGCSAMRVQRFRSGQGAHDAETLYAIAIALGYEITLTPVRVTTPAR